MSIPHLAKKGAFFEIQKQNYGGKGFKLVSPLLLDPEVRGSNLGIGKRNVCNTMRYLNVQLLIVDPKI
jgi:hypothetical protein